MSPVPPVSSGSGSGAACPLVWHGHRWALLPDRALWWETRRSIVVADLHLGKEGYFQARGLPVPDGATLHDLARLGDLVRRLEAMEVLILGDLVHGPGAWRPEVVAALDAALPARRLLIPGNHDAPHAPVPDGLRFSVLAEGSVVDGIALRHVPTPGDADADTGTDTGAGAGAGRAEDAGGNLRPPELAGHVHPVHRLMGPGDALRLPCFVVSARQIILPAFGSFTGGFRMEPSAHSHLYVAVQDRGAGPGFVSRVPERMRGR
jgi:uncharacterized protein